MYGLPPVVYSGFAVLLSDAVGFIAPLLIDIGVIREPAISAMGMADHSDQPNSAAQMISGGSASEGSEDPVVKKLEKTHRSGALFPTAHPKL
jgi:hypothetical protein